MTSDLNERIPGMKPHVRGQNLIPDEATALEVGIAILEAYYGKQFVEAFEPYRAVLMGDKWAVMGDSPAHKEARRKQEQLGPNYHIVIYGGGAPELTLSPVDGRVENIALAR